MNTIEDLLRSHPFTQGLDDAILALIAGCATNVVFQAGSYVFRQGGDADRFYLLRHGTVALEDYVPGKGPQTFLTVKSGEMLGVTWLVPPYRWAFDARAVELSRAIAFDAVCLRGNTDRGVVNFDFDDSDLDEVSGDPARVGQVLRLARSFAWTQGYLSARGWIEWMRDLPLEHRLTLPDGTRLLAVHASPGKDDGPGVTPATTTEQLTALMAGADADLIVVGHTHWPQVHTLNSMRVINPGSVSNPPAGDTRASYARLQADSAGYTIDFCRVEYDLDASLPGWYREIDTLIERLGLVSYNIEAYKRGAKEDPWSRTVAASMKDVLKPLAGNKDLVVLIKIDREARFDNMVTIIDQLDIANLGRFSILELPEKEKAEVANL